MAKRFNKITANFDEDVNWTLGTIGELCKIDRSYLFRYSEDRLTISNTNEWCAPGIKSVKNNLQEIPIDRPGHSWWYKRVNKLETIHVPKIADLPPAARNIKKFFIEQSIKSIIVVPIGYVDKTDNSTSIIIYEKYKDALLNTEFFSHLIVLWWITGHDTTEDRTTLQVYPNRINAPWSGVFSGHFYRCYRAYLPFSLP